MPDKHDFCWRHSEFPSFACAIWQMHIVHEAAECNVAALENGQASLVVRFRHLHPLAALSIANAVIRGPLAEHELAAGRTQMSNSLHQQQLRTAPS
jgi:hypothetical protein